MIPQPDRGFKREANAQQTTMSTLQKVVKYAEKDDLLLYLTAAFGVIMPGIMYFFYRYVHNRYQNSHKRIKKRPIELARTATIFYCSDFPETKEIAYKLAENLQFDPFVAKIGAAELEKARHSRALLIYILTDFGMSGDDGTTITRFSDFIDFLDELKYERREKSYLRNTHFLILFVGNFTSGNEEEESGNEQKLVNSLKKRLISLESKQLAEFIEIKGKQKCGKELYDGLNDFLRRFNYGEFDNFESIFEENEEYYAEEEESE